MLESNDGDDYAHLLEQENTIADKSTQDDQRLLTNDELTSAATAGTALSSREATEATSCSFIVCCLISIRPMVGLLFATYYSICWEERFGFGLTRGFSFKKSHFRSCR